MTKILSGAIAALLVGVMTSALYAGPVTIKDHYVGGFPTSSRYWGKDVVGDRKYFDVSKMVVDYNSATGMLSVDVSGNYFKHVGKLGTQMGDLFISSDGWNPNSMHGNYKSDSYYTGGEDWEYALVLDDHLGSSGSLGLYEIDDSNIVLSEDMVSGEFRKNQEVQVKNLTDSALSLGSWAINGDVLHMEIDTGGAFSGAEELGLHWGMTCGNDIIEGGVGVNAVPEPATMSLLGIGALCMYGFGLRRKED